MRCAECVFVCGMFTPEARPKRAPSAPEAWPKRGRSVAEVRHGYELIGRLFSRDSSTGQSDLRRCAGSSSGIIRQGRMKEADSRRHWHSFNCPAPERRRVAEQRLPRGATGGDLFLDLRVAYLCCPHLAPISHRSEPGLSSGYLRTSRFMGGPIQDSQYGGLTSDDDRRTAPRRTTKPQCTTMNLLFLVNEGRRPMARSAYPTKWWTLSEDRNPLVVLSTRGSDR